MDLFSISFYYYPFFHLDLISVIENFCLKPWTVFYISGLLGGLL